MTSYRKQRELFLDIETYSSVNIKKSGAYPYVESPDFEVLLVAYAWNDEPVVVLDLTAPAADTEQAAANYYGMQDVIAGLLDPGTLKIAHNNAFERTALGKHVGHYLPPEEWDDTMVLAATTHAIARGKLTLIWIVIALQRVDKLDSHTLG